MNNYKTVWQEVDIKDVMGHFVKGYEFKHEELISFEYFLDQENGKVAFRMLVKEND